MEIVKEGTSFRGKALTALGISVTADALDYFAAPIFSTPIIGDIFDSVVTSLLYSITKSKLSTAVNMAEFIPFVGDLLPVYTLSTLMWISKESKKGKNTVSYKKNYELNPDKNKSQILLKTAPAEITKVNLRNRFNNLKNTISKVRSGNI
jgi:hypothetical protein